MKRYFLLITAILLVFSVSLLKSDDSNLNDTEIEIEISPGYYNFGADLKVGDPPVEGRFTITNASNIFPVCFEDIYFKNNTPEFSLDLSGLDTLNTLLPQHSRHFYIQYTPLSDKGFIRDTLVVVYSDCDSKTAEFTAIIENGNTNSSINVNDIEFEDGYVLENSDFKEINISNSSETGATDRLIITRVQLTQNVKHIGDGALGFQVDKLKNIDKQNPLIIEVDEEFIAPVRFAPVYRGLQEGRIYFTSFASNDIKSVCTLKGLALEHNNHSFSGFTAKKNHTYKYSYDELFFTTKEIAIQKVTYTGSVGGFNSDKTFRIDDSFINGTAFPYFVEASENIPFEFHVNMPFEGTQEAEITFHGEYYKTTLHLNFSYEKVNAKASFSPDTIQMKNHSMKMLHLTVKNNDKLPLAIEDVEYSGDAGEDINESVFSLIKKFDPEDPEIINPYQSRQYTVQAVTKDTGTYNGSIKFISNAVDSLVANLTILVPGTSSVIDDSFVNDYNIYYDRKNDELSITLNTKNQYSIISEIYNLSGQLIFSAENPVFAGENSFRIPVNELKSGVYFLRIKNKDKVILGDKFIIEK